MSKNKFGAFEVGEQVLFSNEVVAIIGKQKGNKTASPNRQSGIVTGNKSKPCTYILSNGCVVRGDKLKRYGRI